MAAEDTAKRVYDEAVVIDGLNVSNWDSDHVYVSLDAGRVTAINATIAVWENFPQTMDNIAGWLRRLREHDDTLLHGRTTRDILQAKEQQKTAVIFGWQNASPIENDLDRLALFHALGVRIIQVTYNDRNLLGNGCYERTDDGLSNFGVDAVKEMNEMGILIDLSHVGERTTLETIELFRAAGGLHPRQRPGLRGPRPKQDGRSLEAAGGEGWCRRRERVSHIPSPGV